MASHNMFTPETQYSKANIKAFEATFGDGFMSAGGLASTDKMTSLYLQELLHARKIDTQDPIRILDVGCGIGGAAFYFASTYKNVRVDGRDINPVGIKIAQEKALQHKLDHLVNFAVMDILKDNTIAENTYDIIYSRDALLHIPHESKPDMYASFYRWLKPNGGILCVGDYCIGHNSAESMSETFKAYLQQRGYYLHSIQGWKQVLTKAGFSPQNITVDDQALWYCQTCQDEIDKVALPGSGRDTFLAQFSQEKLNGLVASYRDKISMTLRGDRSYAMVKAVKHTEASSQPHAALRAVVCNAYKNMSARGWIMSCDGNASARVDKETCILTPSGVMVPDLEPIKCVWVTTATGKARPGEKYKPTSEVALHTLIYQRRPDVGAIVHSHGIYSCAMDCTRVPLPPAHYAVCELLSEDAVDFSSPSGGSTVSRNAPDKILQAAVPCAPYHTYGTRKLAQATADALGPHKAVFMASHGAIVTGANMEEALYNSERLERECEIYFRSMQLSAALNRGPPTPLTPTEIKDLHTADGSYGQEHPDVTADDVIQAASTK